MRIDIRKVFGEIESRQQENAEAKAFIEEKEAECAEAIRGPKDLIEWNDKAINMFNNMRISVSIKEILDEVAKIVDKDRDRLSVDVKSNILSQLLMTKGNWTAWLCEMRNKKRIGSQIGDMDITINLDDQEVVRFIVPFDIKSIQADDRYMYGHLDFVELEEGEAGYSKDKKLCKAVITDKENIMVDYTIRQLLQARDCGVYPYIPGVVLQAIMDINDRDKLHPMDDGMNKN